MVGRISYKTITVRMPGDLYREIEVFGRLYDKDEPLNVSQTVRLLMKRELKRRGYFRMPSDPI